MNRNPHHEKQTQNSPLIRLPDEGLSLAVKKLLCGDKLGHLGLYHYGDPLHINDPVTGSYLWDKFVKNSPNYYQFKRENALLPKVALYLSTLIQSNPVSLVDLGPGSDTSLYAKTLPFLSSIEQIENYIPVDVSSEYLKEIDEAIKIRYPHLNISLQQKNYFIDSISFDVNSIPVFLFLSSNISNLPEISKNGDYKKQLLQILSHFHSCMHTPGYLIVSQDTNQDEVSLLNAYNDPLHVEFSLNILHRIKRDTANGNNDNFSPENWVYKPEWFASRNLLAHSVYTQADQEIDICGKTFFIPKGGRLILDNSHKYKAQDFLDICLEAGFCSIKTFMDDSQKISIHILRSNF